MWIDRKEYERIILDSEKRNAVCTEQARHIASLQASHDWLCVRVTQLEHERAALIENYMGVKVQVPTIVQTPATVARREQQSAAALASAVAPYFTDMGDEEALKQGVGWNEEGEITYSKKS